MGAGAIPLQVEKAFFEKAKGTYKLDVYMANSSYKGEDRVDVSAYGGNFIFVPPKQLLFDYRFKKITRKQFQESYFEFLRSSYINHRHVWDNLLNSDRIVLVCNCNAEDKSCHRFAIIDFLKELGAVYKGILKS